MKRSEAILIIAECLVEPHSDDLLTECSIILSKLEKRGLQPPTRLQQFPKGTIEKHHYPDGALSNTWDDEDEK